MWETFPRLVRLAPVEKTGEMTSSVWRECVQTFPSFEEGIPLVGSSLVGGERDVDGEKVLQKSLLLADRRKSL